jgi:hypothetical protein
VMPAVSNYNYTGHFNFHWKWWLWFKHFYIVTLLHRFTDSSLLCSETRIICVVAIPLHPFQWLLSLLSNGLYKPLTTLKVQRF